MADFSKKQIEIEPVVWDCWDSGFALCEGIWKIEEEKISYFLCASS